MPEGLGPAQLPVANISFGGRAGAETGIEKIEVGGPYDSQGPGDTPSRRQIFTCRPPNASSGEDCARQILTRLARRAYRRPPSEKDVRRLLEFYSDARARQGFDAGIQAALERAARRSRVPVPHRTRQPAGWRPERLPPQRPRARVAAVVLPVEQHPRRRAARRRRSRGQLEDPARPRAARCSGCSPTRGRPRWSATSPRSGSTCATCGPSRPTRTRSRVRRQPARRRSSARPSCSSRASCATIGASSNLLTANYTFVNERLARHYGIPNVYGSHFRRVTLPTRRRRGLLGQGSILTVTSYATGPRRSSAGKWLLENILGAPPPPPPPNVPALPEAGRRREGGRRCASAWKQHRKNPVCASCHAQMDPLGFALENFDAIGQWRDHRRGRTRRSTRRVRCPTARSSTGRPSSAQLLIGAPRRVRHGR